MGMNLSSSKVNALLSSQQRDLNLTCEIKTLMTGITGVLLRRSYFARADEKSEHPKY
uniref:Uncharacterized protein n=1 Tax=Arundo donax TaxID=35708 RepID=A0A0A9A8U9_ARUDO